MDACLEQPGLQGRVRVVAAVTVCGFDRIIAMGFFKGRLAGIVAGAAQGRFPGFQKLDGFCTQRSTSIQRPRLDLPGPSDILFQ